MELTTPQIYAIIAMLTASALAGLIFYCIGLRAGRQATEHLIRKLEKINSATSKSLHKRTEDLIEVNRTLDAREGALSKLRQSLIEEQRDHGEVERGLLNQLAAASRLSAADHAVLIAIAAKLGLAADTFTGLNAHDHAKAARHFQAQALDMAGRSEQVRANHQPHPDTEIIEWLNSHGDYWSAETFSSVSFPVKTPAAYVGHLRDVLHMAIQQQRDETTTAGSAISQLMDGRTERAA